MTRTRRLLLVHYIAGVGHWNWPEYDWDAQWNIADAFNDWSAGRTPARHEALEQLFRWLKIGAYWIDNDAIHGAAHPAALPGLRALAEWWEPDLSGEYEAARPRWGRAPLLLSDPTDNKNVLNALSFQELADSLQSDEFEQYASRHWVEGLCAFVGSFLYDRATHTAYVPERLLGPLSGQWHRVLIPSPFWPVVAQNPPECSDAGGVHFCGPRYFWELEFHWSGSWPGSAFRARLNSGWSPWQSNKTNSILSTGQNPWKRYITRDTWDAVQAGTVPDSSASGWLDDLQPFPRDVIEVTELYGLSSLAALEIASEIPALGGVGRPQGATLAVDDVVAAYKTLREEYADRYQVGDVERARPSEQDVADRLDCSRSTIQRVLGRSGLKFSEIHRMPNF